MFCRFIGQSLFPVLAPGSLCGVVSADLTDVPFSSPDGHVV